MKLLQICAFIALFFLTACKKFDVTNNQSQTTKPKIRYPETAEEKQIVARISEISDILKKVCRNKDVNKEIAAVIKGGFYEDERVKIKDLLNPTTSRAYQTEEIKKFTFKKGAFKAEFEKYAPAPNSNVYLRTDNDYWGDITIYFPYSEMFDLPEYITLTPALYESNEGPGYVILDSSEFTQTVNDDYAYEHPTFIVTNGAQEVQCVNPAWCNRPLDSIPNLNVRRVEIGWARTNENLDYLIGIDSRNSGGNEIVAARTSGYLRYDTDGQITTFENTKDWSFNRLDGRNKRWKPLYLLFDSDWKQDNYEQVFSFFEEDSRGEIKFSGKLETTVKAVINGVTIEQKKTLSYEHTIKNEDRALVSEKFSWNAYVASARNAITPTLLTPIRNNGFFNFITSGLVGTYAGFFAFGNGAAQDTRFLPNGEAWSVINFGKAASVTLPYQIVR
jgi:hypothetical protein